jgi:predicted dehydrogenase
MTSGIQRGRVRLAIVGAGARGAIYAACAARHPDVDIVAVAEPRDEQRQRLAEAHGIAGRLAFRDWREMTALAPLADAAIIATSDAEHLEPATALARRGYHLLLEKPMAPTADECRRIVAAARAAGVMISVCHVLRYTRYTELLKQLVDAGRVGHVASVSHLEPVGYWHQAHSFVRGNWRNTAESSPMLLAKSCHDLDWLRHVVGRPCLSVSSFGSLQHFRPERRPPAATERCLDCPVERECPYSAVKIYLDRLRAGVTHWPVDVLTSDLTEAGVTEALRAGPYGRCVYACDNDVVDHQVVIMEFEGGVTASFTMTGFTRQRDRETRVFGTRGELYGDGRHIEIYDFLTDEIETLDTGAASDGTPLSGHGGGDQGVVDNFLEALRAGDEGVLRTLCAETLESHLMVFAAERSRRERRVVELSELAQ